MYNFNVCIQILTYHKGILFPPNHHKTAKYTVLNLKFEHLIVQLSKPQFLKRKQLNLFHIVTILNVSNNIYMQDPIIHVPN